MSFCVCAAVVAVVAGGQPDTAALPGESKSEEGVVALSTEPGKPGMNTRPRDTHTGAGTLRSRMCVCVCLCVCMRVCCAFPGFGCPSIVVAVVFFDLCKHEL